MIYFLFVFIDVISILFSILTATLAGEKYGAEFSPNILVLVTSFFLIRGLLHWVLFKSVVRRSLDWIRSSLQSIFLIIFLSVLAFITAAIPEFLIAESESSNPILILTNIQGIAFYFLAVPIMMLFLSLAIHKIYKLEPW